MIPWIESHTIQIGFLTLQTWGTLVALGFLLGTWVAYRRAKEKGLDAKRISDLAFWIFLASFLCARAFHVLFYDPAHYLVQPLDAINPMLPGYSMFGGFIGAAIAFFGYMYRYSLDWIAYADALVWGLPWGCGVGRIGCFLIHDHPGTLTHSILGVKYPDGETRHDHGLYLSLIGFATGILFLWLNRKQRRPGFWFGTYMVIEGIVRFVLDFYRVVDVKYFGLTPTQYLAIPMLAVGIWLITNKQLKSKS
ncbi:prolipoprotein diacylglyceryl transferase [Patescibacteria group bacterium]|jgi:phosphatidylglycerol:prolipoprotein diacylglycerol transferase|nr:prolipoprotein diacylglyceryl transferase [Patescibacteria group bacterium]